MDYYELVKKRLKTRKGLSHSFSIQRGDILNYVGDLFGKIGVEYQFATNLNPRKMVTAVYQGSEVFEGSTIHYLKVVETKAINC